jgi:hypothetical protein
VRALTGSDRLFENSEAERSSVARPVANLALATNLDLRVTAQEPERCASEANPENVRQYASMTSGESVAFD